MTGADLARLQPWVARPEISARTVLVTILGDTVRPVASSLWLSQIFQLCAPFGYSSRLIRTSLSRLVGEGWVDNERIGRESRYSLTERAQNESASADARIYSSTPIPWDGFWATVLVNSSVFDSRALERLTTPPIAAAIAALDKSVLVAPHLVPVEAEAIVESVAPGAVRGSGTVAFDARAHALLATSLAACAGAAEYTEFVEGYAPLVDDLDALEPAEAYAYRTALVHDRRRIVLRRPEVSRSILPTHWPGDEAYKLLVDLYPALTRRASDWLSTVLDCDYPGAFADRCVPAAATRDLWRGSR